MAGVSAGAMPAAPVTPPAPAARDTAPESRLATATVVRASGAEAAPLRPSPSTIPSTQAAEPQLPREQQVFEQVAEVIAWVAAGADTDEPAPAGAADRVAPLREREAARSRKAQIAEDVFEGEPPGLERGDVTVTIGTIELTVEAPEPVTDSPVPAVPAARPASAEPSTSPSGLGLTRHYLRA